MQIRQSKRQAMQFDMVELKYYLLGQFDSHELPLRVYPVKQPEQPVPDVQVEQP